MSKYDVVYILTKKGNLTEYLNTYAAQVMLGGNISEQCKEYYAKEREISLIAKFRYETERTDRKRINHCYCKIQCPVNPLPIKGEFEAPCVTAVIDFLTENGWTVTQKAYSTMFE